MEGFRNSEFRRLKSPSARIPYFSSGAVPSSAWRRWMYSMT